MSSIPPPASAPGTPPATGINSSPPSLQPAGGPGTASQEGASPWACDYIDQSTQTLASPAVLTPVPPLPGLTPRGGVSSTVNALFGNNIFGEDQSTVQQQLDQLPDVIKTHLSSCAPSYRLRGMSGVQAQQFLRLMKDIVGTSKPTEAEDALNLAKLLCEQSLKQAENTCNREHIRFNSERNCFGSESISGDPQHRDTVIHRLDEISGVPHGIKRKALNYLAAATLMGGTSNEGHFGNQIARLQKLFAVSKLWQRVQGDGPEALEWLRTSQILAIQSRRGEDEWTILNRLLASTERLEGVDAVVRIAAFFNRLKKIDNFLPEEYSLQEVEKVAATSINDTERWECFTQLVAGFQAHAERNKRSPELSHQINIKTCDNILQQVAQEATRIRAGGYTLQQLKESGEQALTFSPNVSVSDCLHLFRIFLKNPRDNLPSDLALLEKNDLKIPNLVSAVFNVYPHVNLEILVKRLSALLPIVWNEDNMYALLNLCRDKNDLDWNKAHHFLEVWRKQNISIIMSPANVAAVLEFGLVPGSGVTIAQSEERRDIIKKIAGMIAVDNTAEELFNLQMELSKWQKIGKDDPECIVAYIKKCAVAHNKLSSASHRLVLLEGLREFIQRRSG